MKKALLFSVFLSAAASLAVAQTVEGPAVPVNNGVNVEMPLKATIQKTPTLCPVRSAVPRTVNAPGLREPVQAWYGRPYGTLFAGMNEEGGGYATSILLGGGMTTWVFPNRTQFAAEDAEYSWWAGKSDENNISDLMDPATHDLHLPVEAGQYFVPKLTVKSEGRTSSYKYGTGTTVQGQKIDLPIFLAATFEVQRLTTADYYFGGYKAGFGDSNTFGTGDLGVNSLVYMNGEIVLCEDGFKSVGVVGKFEKPVTPLRISEVSMLIITEADAPMPADGSLHMELRALDEEGNLTDEVLAESDMYTPDLKDLGQGQYYVPFVFKEEEGGIVSEYDYTLNQACAVVITGFDKPGYDFCVLSSDETRDRPEGGSAYALLADGSLAYYAYGGSPADAIEVNRMNPYIQLKGFYPLFTTIEASKTVTIRPEGGLAFFEFGGKEYNFAQIASHFKGEDVEIVSDLPSWITSVTVDESAWDEQAMLMYLIEAEPFPEETGTRSAEIVLRAPSVEMETTFTVIQKSIDAISVEIADQYKVVRSGDVFQVSYPAGATSVMVVNALGQNVAQYDLPAGGQTTIPAAVLSNGLNIFKFNGAGNIAVKAMK